MKNKLAMLGTGLMVMASPMFAQATTAAPAVDYNLPAAYIAMGVAAGLCGLGQARVVGQSAEAIARNPGATAAIRLGLILGLVFIESLALFTLVVTFIARKV